MSIDRRTARQLCNAAELELVLLSFPDQVGSLSAARLRLKRTRARALRDKYRDLLRRQKLATRDRTGSKLGQSPKSNLRTAEKATLFDETLKRFEARIAAVETATKLATKRVVKPGARAGSTKPAKTTKKASVRTVKSAPLPSRKVPSADPAAAARSPKAPAKGPSTTSARPPSGGYMSAKALAASRRQRLQAMGSIKVRAHVGARGKRMQAKRDSRPR